MPDSTLPELSDLQRWFQAVMTHPGGVDEGIASDEAQTLFTMKRDELEKLVGRSKRLTAAQRLGIYANAYYARLLECLGETFVVFKRTVGDELFNDFAFGYLQAYPSRSYTLNRLGENFPLHLEQTRPATGAGREQWPDFLIDLARLEWTVEQVFDGPGLEGGRPLTAASWQTIRADAWPAARMVTTPSLRLMHFRFPVNTFYGAVRAAPADQEVPVPGPREQWVAVSRRDYIVRRYDLTATQHRLLEALQLGQSVGVAIEKAAVTSQMTDADLAGALESWFRLWAAEQLFARVEH
jgi:hypothetical protein